MLSPVLISGPGSPYKQGWAAWVPDSASLWRVPGRPQHVPEQGDQRGVGLVPPTRLGPVVLASSSSTADGSRNLSRRMFQGRS